MLLGTVIVLGIVLVMAIGISRESKDVREKLQRFWDKAFISMIMAMSYGLLLLFLYVFTSPIIAWYQGGE